MNWLAAFIRKKIALYFARKAARNAVEALLLFIHYPKGTIGHEKGRLFATVADVYSRLDAAFGEKEQR